MFKADGTRWLNPPNGRGAKDSDIPDTGKGRSDWVSDLRQFSEHWLPAFDGVCETLRGATRDDGNIASGTAGVFLLDGIDRKSSTQMWNVMELLQTPEKGPACTNVLNQILQTYMKVHRVRCYVNPAGAHVLDGLGWVSQSTRAVCTWPPPPFMLTPTNPPVCLQRHCLFAQVLPLMVRQQTATRYFRSHAHLPTTNCK